MAYINTTTGQYPIYESEIRAANLNISFPVPFVAPDPYVWVFPTPQPEYNPVIQVVHQVDPLLINVGHYEEQWEIRPRFTDYVDAEGNTHTAKDQESAALAKEEEAKTLVSLQVMKAVRYDEVSKIVVTTGSGKSFDGNEDAQNRMARALAGMNPEELLVWVLADNTIAQVAPDELREALRLAGEAQTRIWIKPYQ